MQFRSKTGRILLQVFWLCVVGAATLCPLRAQAVRPVIAEYNEKARGRFDLVNDSVLPLNVVLEAQSFSIDEDGSPAFRPLEKEIQLKLSQKSFRIPPQQTYCIFYEASAPRYPAWFVIYASFSGLPQQSGLNVQVELPHTVYMGQKVALNRDEVQIGRADYLPASKQVQLEIKNLGDRLGRVSEIEVQADRENVSYPGFPLMPGSKRKVVVEWKSVIPPQRATVTFKNFKIDTALEEHRN